jgi:ABC-type uncharacterized transport system substrate-binding protein
MGGSGSADAAKTATTEIPVLFIGGPDPVADGLVSSFNPPNSKTMLVGIPSRNALGG